MRKGKRTILEINSHLHNNDELEVGFLFKSENLNGCLGGCGFLLYLMVVGTQLKSSFSQNSEHSMFQNTS